MFFRAILIGFRHGVHDCRVESSVCFPLEFGNVAIKCSSHVSEALSTSLKLGLEYIDTSECALLLQLSFDVLVKGPY